MKQTQMYVCTLVEFILEDLDTLLHRVELIYIGNYTVFIQSSERQEKM